MGLDMFLRDKKNNIELIYWRKANQIRKWFVEHLENFDFDDNLGHYDVSKEVLENLADDIELDNDEYSHENIGINALKDILNMSYKSKERKR